MLSSPTIRADRAIVPTSAPSGRLTAMLRIIHGQVGFDSETVEKTREMLAGSALVGTTSTRFGLSPSPRSYVQAEGPSHPSTGRASGGGADSPAVGRRVSTAQPVVHFHRGAGACRGRNPPENTTSSDVVSAAGDGKDDRVHLLTWSPRNQSRRSYDRLEDLFLLHRYCRRPCLPSQKPP